jgi:hypothetical protein
MPNQCEWNELAIFPCSNHAMECPMPQPGHHCMPANFNGHKVKCDLLAGSLKARAIMAAIQNINSKFLVKNVLVNFI